MEIDFSSLQTPDLKFVRKLGQGGQGQVLLFEDKRTRKDFCLKIIRITSKRDKLFILREQAIMRKIDHPNIIKTQLLIHQDKFVVQKMPFMSFGDLNKYMNSPFSNVMINNFLLQLALGLDYLHSRLIMHRDIKPQNVLVKFEDMQAIMMLTDFGMSRNMDNAQENARTYCGTPSYMAPEVLNGLPYTFKADVYSLGVLVYCMIENKMPYNCQDAKNVEQIIERQKSEQITFDNDEISQTLKDLCTSMLQLDPKKRPTCKEIIQVPCVYNEINHLMEFYSKNDGDIHVIFKLMDLTLFKNKDDYDPNVIKQIHERWQQHRQKEKERMIKDQEKKKNSLLVVEEQQ